MLWKEPKNREGIFWTLHVKNKMRYYCLSEKKVLAVLRNPDRKEEGVAPETVALMKRAGTRKNPGEIWMMYQAVKSRIARKIFLKGKNLEQKTKIKIISAWRYPGKSPAGKAIPIPEDILEELRKLFQYE